MDTDKRDVAYEIDDVVLAEPFKVYKSANAWWMEKIKVQQLVEGFKKAYTIKEALILAGISEIQNCLVSNQSLYFSINISFLFSIF